MNSPKIHAPQLPNDPALWLNTGGKAFQLEKGVLYLLDFWTYCCINCLHIIPDLKYLEERFAGRPFCVIGVHSGKFDNEKDNDNLRNAILRHDIRHPVLRDDDYRVWRDYSVHAWPTLVLVSPDGYFLGALSGEGHRDALATMIETLLDTYAQEGTTRETPPIFALEADKELDPPLYYPGKVFADEIGDRLFIADTRHNRIVMTRLDGSDYKLIGSGEVGQDDGDFKTATFHQPQGIALSEDGNSLFVCDCENHLIRQVDLLGERVDTVAGTGTQGQERASGGIALVTPLSSPWDIVSTPAGHYIAMAGTHQIWALTPDGRAIPAYGSGREGRVDGEAEAAAFAQPSGIALDTLSKSLFVADSEISAIRRITPGKAEPVSTLAGGDLFDFGDVDGFGDEVRLQHPLGICVVGETVYFTDTFNHKIKMLDPKTGEVKTFAGTGKAGFSDGSWETAQFYEPAGISHANGKLYIADTNNHSVRVLDLSTKEVETLNLAGLCGNGLCFPPRFSKGQG